MFNTGILIGLKYEEDGCANIIVTMSNNKTNRPHGSSFLLMLFINK